MTEVVTVSLDETSAAYRFSNDQDVLLRHWNPAHAADPLPLRLPLLGVRNLVCVDARSVRCSIERSDGCSQSLLLSCPTPGYLWDKLVMLARQDEGLGAFYQIRTSNFFGISRLATWRWHWIHLRGTTLTYTSDDKACMTACDVADVCFCHLLEEEDGKGPTLRLQYKQAKSTPSSFLGVRPPEKVSLVIRGRSADYTIDLFHRLRKAKDRLDQGCSPVPSSVTSPLRSPTTDPSSSPWWTGPWHSEISKQDSPLTVEIPPLPKACDVAVSYVSHGDCSCLQLSPDPSHSAQRCLSPISTVTVLSHPRSSIILRRKSKASACATDDANGAWWPLSAKKLQLPGEEGTSPVASPPSSSTVPMLPPGDGPGPCLTKPDSSHAPQLEACDKYIFSGASSPALMSPSSPCLRRHDNVEDASALCLHCDGM
eukprot:CAMPEP_0114548808 /NCGR_PEP_ID=MMETSP0114-20121206/5185_1 /TAXON_ID=31324 /ORGANISM="Goniomonas sp, Strain m" /LENGTH=425 /DNA_ID=CAMNT_0001733435 /DNA_START=6 /DNA_END=1283 /DNA_ORIENTATION=+